MEKKPKVVTISVKSNKISIKNSTKPFNREKGKWYIDPNDLSSLSSITIWLELHDNGFSHLTLRPNRDKWIVYNKEGFYFSFKYLATKDFLEEFEDHLNYEMNRPEVHNENRE